MGMKMGFGTQRKSITIEKVDGGFVLDWNDPKERDSYLDQMSGFPRKPDPPSTGREIYTDQKKMLKRFRDFFGITP
jgi:hypothetical protein